MRQAVTHGRGSERKNDLKRKKKNKSIQEKENGFTESMAENVK